MSSLVFVLAPFLIGPAFGFVVLFVHFLVTEPNPLYFVLNLVIGGGYFLFYRHVYFKLMKKYPDRF